MKNKLTIILFLLAGLLTACNLSAPPDTNTVLSTASTLPPSSIISATSIPSIAPQVAIIDLPAVASTSPQQAVLDKAFAVIKALEDQDMPTLSGYVHPLQGLRFSPYAYVNEADQVFSADQVASLLAADRTYTWGTFSGSGESIDMSFMEYYAQFIYDEDFAQANEMSLNHRLGVSTSMDNIVDFYPTAMVVEFHFPGFDPQLEGMDWRSLRLVFIQSDSTWYLVGIVHDQWTT